MSRGFCPYCSGPATFELGDEYFEHMDVDETDAPAVLFRCTHCHWFLVSTIEKPLQFHPAVTSLFAIRGVDIWDVSGWDDTLEVVVDESLDVLRSETREESGV